MRWSTLHRAHRSSAAGQGPLEFDTVEEGPAWPVGRVLKIPASSATVAAST
jgi:hypothetical protein